MRRSDEAVVVSELADQRPVAWELGPNKLFADLTILFLSVVSLMWSLCARLYWGRQGRPRP